MEARVLATPEADLGEGPVWDHVNQRLVWVNITAAQVLATTLDGTTTVLFTGPERFGPSIGFTTPWRDGWLIGQFQTLLFTTDWQTVRPVGRIEGLGPSIRINDGKLGPDNQLVFGTLCNDGTDNISCLYQVDLNTVDPAALRPITADEEPPTLRVTTLATEVGISNGLAWAAAGDKMFYIDTVTRRVDVFDWADGQASNRRPWVEFPVAYGFPDGMTIDADDHLWVAFWSGNAIRSVSPDRTISEPIAISAHNPTSVAVGEAATLFVTSARTDSPEAPTDGGLFIIDRSR